MVGKFLGSLFGGAEPARGLQAGEGPPPSSEQDDLRRAALALEQLRRTVLRSGALHPTIVHSQVRQILDLLGALIRYIGEFKASTEQLVLLEAILSDYLPGALRAYMLVPETSRQDESPETRTLLAQLRTLHATATDLDRQVRTGAVTELAVHGRFLQDKFDLGSLHLEGR
ncbi:hypothetical protein [Arthrobacter pityocampae]|uniref:hypothetical protein n=1 Tax=Arthrobacter pityocampae TaxID=547334 RepID=UPI003736E244